MLLEVPVSKAVSSLPTLSTPIPGQGGNLSYREQDNCISVWRTILVWGIFFFSLTNMCFIMWFFKDAQLNVEILSLLGWTEDHVLEQQGI